MFVFKKLTPEMALEIYRMGGFPMAETAESEDFEIYEARERSLLPFQNLHVPRSLRKKLLKEEFTVKVDTSFSAVIDACAEMKQTRHETWINQPIKDVFNQLHDLGYAHCVECWKGEELIGGLYGLQIGSAFCGESMFSRATDASKVALVHLCARMKATGFTLLDAQLENPHLAQFGQMIVTQADYLQMLETAKTHSPDFLSVQLSETELVSAYLNQIRNPAP